MTIYDKYETIIGLEIHVQLATKTKAFCADAVRFGSAPNTHTSVISLAHPGTLPRLNKQQVEYAVRLGLALKSHINQVNMFDRKNYFYADLPKGYQITQDKQPICIGGEIPLSTGKTIRFHHIHMEEDAGKSIHDQDPSVSFIDLNRAGTPLLEIVTEPDLRSGEEVDALMTAMRQLVRYLGISDGNMEEGSMRCDVNISVRLKGTEGYNTRCEVKNVNSMRFARRAIEFESKRQIDILENGGKIEQNTLNFDPATGVTTPLRSKENAHDYRYFPDPDLPPVVISDEKLEDIKAKMPALPWEVKNMMINQYQIPKEDAIILSEEKEIADYTLSLMAQMPTPQYKAAANMLVQKIIPYINESKISIMDFPLTINQLKAFLSLIDNGKISNSVAYQTLFPKIIALNDPSVSVEDIAEKMNLIQSADTDFLSDIVKNVLAQNPEKVSEYRKGKKGLIGFFMGEVMKQSKGKAEPKTTNALIVKALEG
jgi:aspartyl-tRNA(Asn)/glutamyl-tRNA(Gln) amidotransferase subunit B